MDTERRSDEGQHERRQPSAFQSGFADSGSEPSAVGSVNTTDADGGDHEPNKGGSDRASRANGGEDEEFAAEVAVPDPPAAYRGAERNEPAKPAAESDARDDQGAGEQGGVAVGWFALALAIASLFVWPALLGPAAVLFGFVSWMQGSRALGIWSIVLGIISFIAYLALAPLYR